MKRISNDQFNILLLFSGILEIPNVNVLIQVEGLRSFFLWFQKIIPFQNEFKNTWLSNKKYNMFVSLFMVTVVVLAEM